MVARSSQFGGWKICGSLDRVSQLQVTGNCPPVVVDLNLTDVCNHHCPACKGYRTGTASLTLEQVTDYLTQFRDFGGKAVSFGGGGDPLCHPQFSEALDVCCRLGLEAGVITNGQGLDDRGTNAIIRNCTWCRVSLDADCQETHARTHGTRAGQFEAVRENIRSLVGRRGHCDRPMIGVGFLTNEELRPRMEGAVDLARRLGVDYLHFRPFLGDLTDVSDEIRRLQRAYDDERFKVVASMHKYEAMNAPERSYGICWIQNLAAVITADGKMGVCCDLKREGNVIGDLTKQTLKEIWFSKRRQEVVTAVELSKCVPLCRGNGVNEVVDRLMRVPEHASFL